MSALLAPLHPPKRLLYGPGPTMVEPRVYEAMRQPIVGHLDPYFFRVVEDIAAQLRVLFGTSNKMTLPISGTGSAGMETAVANFVTPGSKMAVLANGFFCDRVSEMGRRYGADVVRLEKPWGEFFTDEEADEFIRREKPQVVAFVNAETSTGVRQMGHAICSAAHDVGAIVIADCVTSLGAMPIGVDDMGIDVAFSCSQKGLSAPPGLAPVTVSPRALEWLKANPAPSRTWYLDLRLLEDYFEGSHRYHHTAPISMFYALREALALIAEEGAENRWQRHLRTHLAFVAGVEAMGLEMLVAEGHRIWNLNTPKVPEGVDDLKMRQQLLASHDIEILGGFGPLAGKIFRIGIMGPLANEEAVLFLLSGMEEALRAQGFQPKASGREAAAEQFRTAAPALA